MLIRGEYELANQPQIIKRDLQFEEISKHLGGFAHAYRVTESQAEERKRRGIYYHYQIFFPGSYGTNWTAFRTREDMNKWLDAYGMSLDVDPQPGDQFRVLFPASVSEMKDLIDDGREYAWR
ncbi:hypothetical protein ACFVYF_18895 [Streptomyces sp. NPDC058274]|uniref:hypothetical protein n=1 Tax=Streptomyces sp. NPDC058274 TaxID=3346416 RepID=UPI0036E520E6